MKQIYLLPLLACCALSASAVVPFVKGQTSPPASRHSSILTPANLRGTRHLASAPARAAQWQTLYEEDFSKFSAGSEQDPAPVIEFENVYHIPESYTSQPGWTGQGVRPAGGCVALYPWTSGYGDTRGGYISTPPTMLAGTAVITLRAKRLGTAPANLWISLCDDYYGPGDDVDCTLTDEWATYTLQAAGSLEDPSYFQICIDEGVGLIDDVKVTFRRDRISAPEVHDAVNLSDTEFLASWESTGAPLYRLNVLCTSPDPNGKQGVMLEGFDSLNALADGKSIDLSNPGYPQGWDINVSKDSPVGDLTDDYDNKISGRWALVMDAVTDSITSPVLPAPLDALSFWVRPSQYTDDDTYMSLLRLDLYHSRSQKWETMAHLPYYYMEQEGGEYVISPYALGDDVTQVRFSMIQKGAVSFYIDDVRLSYASRGITSPLIKDLDLTECEYKVSSISHANEYIYFVQSVDGDLVSATSNEVWVDGVAGLPVQMLPPSDGADGAFTVSWKPLGHADTYSLQLSSVTVADAPMQDVTIIEENFDRINQGTVQNPGSYWISPYDFGVAGWADNNWCATNPAWAAGMAGSLGTTWYGTAGLVYSPRLNLSCNGGTGFDVEATVVTTTDAFDYYGQDMQEGVFVMVLDTYMDPQAKAFALIETPTVGSHSAKVHVPVAEGVDLKDVIVAFMSMSGQTFFVDDVRISQDLLAGDVLFSPKGSVVTGATSYRYKGLEPGAEYGVTVTASVEHDYVNYVSLPSETVRAIASESGVSLPSADLDGTEEVYTLSGLRLTTPADALPAGLYIVRTANGQTSKVLVK